MVEKKYRGSKHRTCTGLESNSKCPGSRVEFLCAHSPTTDHVNIPGLEEVHFLSSFYVQLCVIIKSLHVSFRLGCCTLSFYFCVLHRL